MTNQQFPHLYTQVFRELLQNADDAQAREVEIEFRSKACSITEGVTNHGNDLNMIQVTSGVTLIC